MKLLTALIASASVLALTPSIASASPLADRGIILDTFCSYPTLAIKNGGSALEDCVQIAMEADSRGYDEIAIKRVTDRFTADTIGTSRLAVSAYTNGRIVEFVESVKAGTYRRRTY